MTKQKIEELQMKNETSRRKAFFSQNVDE